MHERARPRGHLGWGPLTDSEPPPLPSSMSREAELTTKLTRSIGLQQTACSSTEGACPEIALSKDKPGFSRALQIKFV